MRRIQQLFLILMILALAACNRPSEANPDVIRTSAAETVVAQATEAAVSTLAVQLTHQALTPSPTQTPLPSATSSVTPTLQYSLTPSVTPTPVTPTVTQTPLPTWTPLATSTPLVRCNQLKFVTDVTIPDGTVMKPGATFVKTWRLTNIGSCAWTTKYALIFAGNTRMEGPKVATLTAEVRPGQTVDLSVTLKSPDAGGEYTGLWKMMDDKGVSFGGGASANASFWVKIKVDPALATFNSDMVKNFCSAEWRGNGGVLPCPGTSVDFTNGSITYVDGPLLEGKLQEDEGALLTVPTNGTNGFISGKYPQVTIENGQHFYAMIACLNDSTTCSVKFRLNYQEVGSTTVQNLNSWTEIYDGVYTKVDVDLSSLAGKKVNLILEVQNYNNTSQDDRAVWVSPRIAKP